MKALVALKRVIDPAWLVRLKDGRLDDQDAPWVLNPYDEVALEEALRLKEQGALNEILAVSCGPIGCVEVLRSALALGADRALHVPSETPLDALAVARLLAAIARREGCALILLGKQASDSDAGLTGPLLAGLLGCSQATAVIALQASDGAWQAVQQREAGQETLLLTAPAVVSADLRLNQPRYASLPNLLRAKRLPIETMAPADLGVADEASALSLLELTEPLPRPAGRQVRDVAELVEQLAALGVRKRDASAAQWRSTTTAAVPTRLTIKGPPPRVLLLAEQHEGQLASTTAALLGAALHLTDRAEVLLCGPGAAAAALKVAELAGVSQIWLAEDAQSVEILAQQIAIWQADQGYAYLLLPSTASGRALLGRLAALLDVLPLSNVQAILATDTFVHSLYAGALRATYRLTSPVKLLGLRPGGFAAVGARLEVDPPTIAVLPSSTFTAPSQRLAWTPASGTSLATAPVVVAGGRGLGSAENFQRLLAPLAALLGGALAATRSAVDAGFAPLDRLVGQSGHLIAPRLYLAIGLSGAAQHLAGVEGDALVVAIDKDPAAPIHRRADLSLVADLFAAVPELTRRLEAWPS